jgi:hypothetical protein
VSSLSKVQFYDRRLKAALIPQLCSVFIDFTECENATSVFAAEVNTLLLRSSQRCFRNLARSREAPFESKNHMAHSLLWHCVLWCIFSIVASQEGVLVLDYNFERETPSDLRTTTFSFGESYTLEGTRKD